MTIRGVIFDLWGTLIDEPADGTEGLLRELAENLHASYEAFVPAWETGRTLRGTGKLATIGLALRHLCNELGLTPTAATLAKAEGAYRAAVTKDFFPRPDAAVTLAALRARGLRLGLISNCSPIHPELFAATPLANYFEAPLFSNQIGMLKPDPRIYQLALARLELPAADCLYVGDGDSHEFEGALAVGLRPVMVPYDYDLGPKGYRFTEKELFIPAIARPCDLPDLLDGLP